MNHPLEYLPNHIDKALSYLIMNLSQIPYGSVDVVMLIQALYVDPSYLPNLDIVKHLLIIILMLQLMMDIVIVIYQ